jgi:hypothetical protein
LLAALRSAAHAHLGFGSFGEARGAHFRVMPRRRTSPGVRPNLRRKWRVK